MVLFNTYFIDIKQLNIGSPSLVSWLFKNKDYKLLLFILHLPSERPGSRLLSEGYFHSKQPWKIEVVSTFRERTFVFTVQDDSVSFPGKGQIYLRSFIVP